MIGDRRSEHCADSHDRRSEPLRGAAEASVARLTARPRGGPGLARERRACRFTPAVRDPAGPSRRRRGRGGRGSGSRRGVGGPLVRRGPPRKQRWL